MADVNLTQEDADVLPAMEKHKTDDVVYDYPSLGGGIRVPLASPDKRESFFLDITRSQIALARGRTRIVPGVSRFWLASISAARLIEIRTMKKFRARTCTFTVKATAIAGRYRCPRGGSLTLAIPGCCC